MSVVNVEDLVREISPEKPCGENLEYDPAFQELERMVLSKPEQQLGDIIIPAEDPNWREVKQQAIDLLAKSKDLRIAVSLLQALTQTNGLAGLNDGLAVLHGLLNQYWASIFPELDEDDDNDPTMRINTILSLVDPASILQAVGDAPLVRSSTMGKYSIRDIQIATGSITVSAGDEELPELPAIEAAFMECDLDELQQTADAVTQGIGHIDGIDSLLTSQAGPSNAPDLSALANLLKEGRKILSEQLSRRGVAGADDMSEGDEPVKGTASQPVSGEIRSREDVIRVLDKACEYFQRNEPSSPVPLLLQRAKRLVSKNFMEIMRDMAPDGISQAEMISGLDRNEE